LEVAALIVELIVVIDDELTPPTVFTVGKSAVPPKSLANFMIPLAMVVASVAELDILERTKAAVAISVLLALGSGVGAVGLPVKDGDEMVGETIVLLDKDSTPVNVASVPTVGKVIFVAPVLIKFVLKLPEVDKLPPRLIVLVPLFTPVPPKVPAIACDKSVLPSNSLPYIFLAVANCVVVLALPAKLAVIIPELKFPLASLLTKVFAVLLEVAAAISAAIEAMVEELTPPILLDEAVILERTKAAVAISVPLAASIGVGAFGLPVKVGEAKFAFKFNAFCVAVLIGLFKSLVLLTFVILALILFESVNIFALKILAVSAKEPLAEAASAFTFSAENKPNVTQFELSKFGAFNLYIESTS